MIPRIENLVGAINGVNREYTTSLAYKDGSVRVWINGAVLDPGLNDGFVELGNNKIRMKVAPETGDVLRVYYVVRP